MSDTDLKELQTIIADMNDEDRGQVQRIAANLRTILAHGGQHAEIALALVTTEVTTQGR